MEELGNAKKDGDGDRARADTADADERSSNGRSKYVNVEGGGHVILGHKCCRQTSWRGRDLLTEMEEIGHSRAPKNDWIFCSQTVREGARRARAPRKRQRSKLTKL